MTAAGQWKKSSRSQQSTSCVEVNLGATVGVRDTKARKSGTLRVPATAWRAFVATTGTDIR
ncbi:DUF397 domain-containing protein [Amycolatopsis sp. CA-230715]|uniref:DUF397 domain-containing protein n=1 Tax=Amycolatopsis sp. CA-230715 TaxID=2745196 RepID=UPI001C033DFD|nr:DUF397 domain-containing protein [Amycolatopsis sp. CA-230715]QWF81264.1 hypothetical protein HUW46_04694 [Amycolatopsis sp. CA-230715]